MLQQDILYGWAIVDQIVHLLRYLQHFTTVLCGQVHEIQKDHEILNYCYVFG